MDHIIIIITIIYKYRHVFPCARGLGMVKARNPVEIRIRGHVDALLGYKKAV